MIKPKFAYERLQEQEWLAQQQRHGEELEEFDDDDVMSLENSSRLLHKTTGLS